MRKWIALCLALALMPALALGEELGFGLTTVSGGGETLTRLEEAPAERAGEVTEGGLLARPLPIDFSPGMPPREVQIEFIDVTAVMLKIEILMQA